MTQEWQKPEQSKVERDVTFWGKLAGGKDAIASEGSLIGFEVLEYAPQTPCYKGELKDVVYAHATVIDGPNAGERLEKVRVEPKAVVGWLQANLGQSILVRLVKESSKDGGNKYWNLEPATDEDFELAAPKKAPWEK